jgi:LacI family repressor for deo operon, udp, cdd, tsx, nupC, and nupG
MGKKAMELLINLINNEEVERNQFILDDELIIRDSCKEYKK